MFYIQLLETEEEKLLFEELYENHRGQMRYVAYQVLRNGHLAEDAVHNAFMGLIENMSAIYGRGSQDQKNYLLKAAKNCAINLAKKEHVQENYYVNYEPVEDDVLEALCTKLDRETVVGAIMKLKEPYNTVLYCHFVMEMGHEEIATQLQRKPDTIRQQLSRGRKLLQVLLEEAMKVHV